MINYIKAELYRSFNRKYFYFLTGILCAMALSLNLLFKFMGFKIGLIGIMKITVSPYGFNFPIIVILMVIDMINVEEYKNGTLKNIISFGMSRSKMFLSKFIVIIILSFIIEISMLIVFWGSGALLFQIGNTFSSYAGVFIIRLFAVVLPWISVIAVGMFLNTVLNNTNAFTFTYFGVFAGIPLVIKFLSFFIGKGILRINDFLITGLITVIADFKAASENMIYANVYGMIYIAIFIILGLVCFNKKDIK